MSRADEIAQGLRTPDGALTFALVAEEYTQGYVDAKEGQSPPPGLTTPSYDLGRARRVRELEQQAEHLTALEAQFWRRHEVMREILPPDIFADHEANVLKARGLHEKTSDTP